jgi:2-dehydro-3-deoxyphosphogluconate aldolase/(4S)-4-hydroxy-2-oxoglutarate aldolase
MLLESRTIAVLRATDAGAYEAAVDVLVENGLRSIELTLSTPGTIDCLRRLTDRVGPAAEIGVGTVLDVDQAERAMDAGASYLVTPSLEDDVIAAAVRRGIPVFPGGLTPSELKAGWIAGATAVKIFPAATVGPSYAAHLLGPFPGVS